MTSTEELDREPANYLPPHKNPHYQEPPYPDNLKDSVIYPGMKSWQPNDKGLFDYPMEHE